MRKNRLFSFFGAACAALMLASCSNINPNLPLDYKDGVVTVLDKNGNEVNVPFNYKRQYYDDVGDINATAVDAIIDYIASELTKGNIKDEDGNTLHLYSSEADEPTENNSVTVEYVSGLDESQKDTDKYYTYSSYVFDGVSKEIQTRTEKAMLDMVSGGSYDYNNVFDEYNFALTLNKNNLAGIDASKVEHTLDKNQVVVNANSEFSDVFTPDLYNDYINRTQVTPIVENMMTAQYIYNQRFTSILNAGVRYVSIAALTDRDDMPGAAQSLINVYYQDYLSQGKTIEAEYADDPLEELCVLWKGVPEAEGGELTQAQQDFLDANNLSTLYDQIDTEISKIHLDNPLLTDQDLQDEYTGSGAYSVAEGRKRAVNSLLKKDIYTEELAQESDLSDLPDSVTNQIFAVNMETSRTGEIGGHRYIKPTTSSSSSTSASAITIYDADSDTYYLAMIDDEDIYNSSTLHATKADNEEDPVARAKAMDVAYKMNASSTYRTDGVVYWIKNFVGDGKLVVQNQDFYDYLESSYPDLFEED